MRILESDLEVGGGWWRMVKVGGGFSEPPPTSTNLHNLVFLTTSPS
jgi:hypothetical protein